MSLVVRAVRTLGDEQLYTDVVLVAPPTPGMRLDLTAAGAGLLRVEDVVLLPRGDTVGFLAPGILALLAAEPATGAQAAQDADWRPLPATT